MATIMLRWTPLLLTAFVWLPSAAWSAPVAWPADEGGNDHWYEVVNQSVSWPAAKDAAAAKSILGLTGHLVTISNAAEDTFVQRLAETSGDLNGATWLGLTDNEAFGGQESWNFGWPDRKIKGWVWVTGESVSYTHWGTAQGYAAEPNDLAGEDFGQLWSFSNTVGRGLGLATWNDGSTGATRYIVEYEPVAAVPEPNSLALAFAGLVAAAFGAFVGVSPSR